MAEKVAITASIDPGTASLVERAAAKRGVTVAQYVATSVQRVAESDADFDAFIQVGIDAAERGDVIPHEDVMAELDAMIAAHRQRCTG